MGISICPRCQVRIMCEGNIEDIEHECNSGNTTLDNEDVIIMGSWEDYTGSAVVNNAELQGISNKLWGTRAWVEGERKENVKKKGDNNV